MKRRRTTGWRRPSVRKSETRRDPSPHRPGRREGAYMKDAYRQTPAFRRGGSKYEKSIIDDLIDAVLKD